MSVPFVDLLLQHRAIAQEVSEGFDAVLAKGDYIGGAAVGEFEREFAAFIGARHCVGVANGTDAIEMALRAVGAGQGSEVIIPANTFVATAEAVVRAGATPVLVDVDDDTLLIDPQAVAAAVTARTRAVIPVHLYGQTAPVDEVRVALGGADIVIVEDAAQSQGARRNGRSAGSLGDIAGTSFYPGKNLGAYGDGGAVTTNDSELARQVRMMGGHGSEQKYHHEIFGFNSRLDTIQAVVLRAKLKQLDGWNVQRRSAADVYQELLGDVDGVRLPVTAAGNEHVWHLYVVRVDDRDHVLSTLQGKGIGVGIHYPFPIHSTKAFDFLGYSQGAFPVAEKNAGQILSLPMFPGLDRQAQDQVAEALAATVR